MGEGVDVMSREKGKKVIVVITFCLLVAMLLVANNRLGYVFGSEVKQGQVVKCGSEWVKVRHGGQGSTVYRDQVQYMPVVETEDGDKVVGDISVVSRSLCQQMLGKEMAVLVHPDDPDKNKVYSFVQFWFLSSLLFAFGGGFLLAFRSPKLSRLVILSYLVAVPIVACDEFGVLERYVPQLYGQAGKSHSEAALDRCVWASMNEEGVQDRRDLKRLLCQDEEIDDLSAIADLISLEELYLQGNALTSLDGLREFSKLKKLSVAGNKTLKSVSGIEGLIALEEFQANKAGISDLSGMENLKELRIIGLMMNDLSDISPLASLDKLEDVTFNYNKIRDISALGHKPQLRELQIYSNPVADISPLFSNVNMTLVGVTSEAVPCAQIEQLRSVLSEDVRIYGPKSCE